MAWEKLGRIFDPEKHRADWFVSHAALPVVEALENNLLRVYFSGRDSEGRAQIGFFEFDITRPQEILHISPEPIISLGELGTFDDRGVTASCLTQYNGRHYFFYTGWNLGVTVPFYFFVGLAVRDAGQTDFHKISPAPIMERHPVDPYLLGSSFVMVEKGIWRMWYISAVSWKKIGDEVRHYYLVKYAESADGIHWRRDGHVCIDFAADDEYAIARPCVVKDAELYRMWYAYRGDHYRIGYAESPDGLDWQRKDDQAGIMVSQSGWDSEMIEYPWVFDCAGNRYMLYNGNGYGKTGIGLAIWHESRDRKNSFQPSQSGGG